MKHPVIKKLSPIKVFSDSRSFSNFPGDSVRTLLSALASKAVTARSLSTRFTLDSCQPLFHIMFDLISGPVLS